MAANSPLSVVLDESVTVGNLVLSNSDGSTRSGFSISAAGSSVLTLDNSGSASQIAVQAGTQVILAPLILAGSLNISPSANSTLTLGGEISESTVGSALSLDDAGTLILSGSNGYTGGTFVNAGTLVVQQPNGLPNGSSLTVGAGAAALFADTMSGTMDPSSWSPGGGQGGEQGAGSGEPAAVPEPGAWRCSWRPECRHCCSIAGGEG